MIVTLSTTASDAMLDMLSSLIDGGSIEILTGNGRVLAVLKFSTPAAKAASGGEIEFNEITEEDAALAQGNAFTARILAADGGEVFSCDVGEEDSDAVIKLNTVKIFRGGPVRLKSFRLGMP